VGSSFGVSACTLHRLETLSSVLIVGPYHISMHRLLNPVPPYRTGANAGCVARPTLVLFFESEGARVIRVSCGFHHTLCIAVPKQATRVFSPSVYAFGFGEYGRLGVGTEEQLLTPTLVQFPGPFHPTQVSAGEQHSVALGHEGCYAWGSNDMGQLGIGSPSQYEVALTPQKVQLPEGMVARRISAGGRHTAAVTHCGNIVSWGWGEEGQLGHGTEKSSSLPRPCRISRVYEKAGVPMDLALGGTHTMVVLHNPGYLAPSQQEEPQPDPEPEPVPEPAR
jgi:alpha-tubulin suppressor-like RCC1 family protein